MDKPEVTCVTVSVNGKPIKSEFFSVCNGKIATPSGRQILSYYRGKRTRNENSGGRGDEFTGGALVAAR